jgi:hypothetical protein
MKTVTMNLDIHRSASDRTTVFRGAVNRRVVQLLVSHGADNGTTSVEGQMGDDRVDVTFQLDRGVVKSAKGVYGPTRIDSTFDKDPKGLDDKDTVVSQFGREIHIDRQSAGAKVSIQGDVIGGDIERSKYDGDEQGRLSVGSEVYDYALDRSGYVDYERTGMDRIAVTGRGPTGSFELDRAVSPNKATASVKGTLPEGLKMFPVLWEIFGDNRQNLVEREFPGGVLAMSLFLSEASPEKV